MHIAQSTFLCWTVTLWVHFVNIYRLMQYGRHCNCVNLFFCFPSRAWMTWSILPSTLPRPSVNVMFTSCHQLNVVGAFYALNSLLSRWFWRMAVVLNDRMWRNTKSYEDHDVVLRGVATRVYRYTLFTLPKSGLVNFLWSNNIDVRTVTEYLTMSIRPKVLYL